MNERQYKLLEDALLKEADLLIEKSKSQGEKALYNLFKSLTRALISSSKTHVSVSERFPI